MEGGMYFYECRCKAVRCAVGEFSAGGPGQSFYLQKQR